MEFAGSKEITLKRLVETQSATGGLIRSYTTAARSGLPTTVKARIIHLNEKQKIEHGVRGDQQGFKFLCETNPQITLNDRVEFSMPQGAGVADETYAVDVVNPSRPRTMSDDASGTQFWVVVGERDTSET